MDLTTLLLILLIIAFLGGLPVVGLHDYGYFPSGVLGVVVVVVLVLMLATRR